jgi:glycosyltransferase involved in cell wall biosynthesis
MTNTVSTLEASQRNVPRPRVSVIIPALNEERNLPHVAAHMPAEVDEVIFVDGNSVDNTAALARELWPDGIHLRQTRKGKGNALSCGFAAATGDIIVMIDADGSTDPAEIPLYVGALLSGADFAKGSRFIQGGGSADITKIRRIGNWGLNVLVNTLFGTKYTDLCYGYNAFWSRCLDSISLPDTNATEPQWGDGFEIETLINVRVAASGLKISEVCSYESHRIHGVSNLNAVSDGLRILRTIRREFWRIRTAPLRTTDSRTSASVSDIRSRLRAKDVHGAVGNLRWTERRNRRLARQAHADRITADDAGMLRSLDADFAEGQAL